MGPATVASRSPRWLTLWASSLSLLPVAPFSSSKIFVPSDFILLHSAFILIFPTDIDGFPLDQIVQDARKASLARRER